jgi:hypothetical protein
VFADQAATPDLEEAGIASQWQSINYGEAFFDSIDPERTQGDIGSQPLGQIASPFLIRRPVAKC